MTALTAVALASTIWLSPVFAQLVSKRVDVDCKTAGALERAMAGAVRLAEVELVLHGVCAGSFVIARDGITLRGATPASGIAAPAEGVPGLPVLEIVARSRAARSTCSASSWTTSVSVSW
jgi:hypothetical protein